MKKLEEKLEQKLDVTFKEAAFLSLLLLLLGGALFASIQDFFRKFSPPTSEEVTVEVTEVKVINSSPSTVKLKIGENGKVITVEVEEKPQSEVMGTSTTENDIEERNIQDHYDY